MLSPARSLPQHRVLSPPLAALLFASLLGAAVPGLVGCASPQERANKDAAAAEQLFAAGDFKQARMAAQNAIEVAPKNVKARYVLARVAEQNGELGQMLGHLEVIIGEDPKHVPARVQMATLLLYAQDYAGAEGLAAAARKIAPDDPTVRLLAARLLLQKGDVAGGLRELDFVLSKQPDNAGAALIRGVTLGLTSPERGLADLAASIQRLPPGKAVPLRKARIDIYNRAGRFADVEREIRALVTDYPTGGYARNLADFYVARQRIDDAEAALAAGVAANPDDVDLKFAYAQFQSRTRNRPDLAEATLKKFIAETPDDERLTVMLGTFYEGTNRDADALAQYEGVAQRVPTSPDGLAARGRMAVLTVKGGDPQGARVLFDAILEDAPDDAAALLGRGQLNLADDKLEDAVVDLRGSLRKAPENPTALTLLAAAHLRAGDIPLAEEAYRQALKINPSVTATQAALADVLLLPLPGSDRVPNERVTEAEQLFRQAMAAYEAVLASGGGGGALAGRNLAANNLAALLLDRRSDATSHQRALDLTRPFADSRNPQFLDTLGWAHYRTGDAVKAVKYLELALAVGGDNAVVRYHLGMAYLAAKNEVGARQDLEKALKRAGQFPGAGEARAALRELSSSNGTT